MKHLFSKKTTSESQYRGILFDGYAAPTEGTYTISDITHIAGSAKTLTFHMTTFETTFDPHSLSCIMDQKFPGIILYDIKEFETPEARFYLAHLERLYNRKIPSTLSQTHLRSIAVSITVWAKSTEILELIAKNIEGKIPGLIRAECESANSMIPTVYRTIEV